MVRPCSGWASVFPVGMPVEMAITPEGMASILTEGGQYQLVIIPMCDDEPRHITLHCQTVITIEAHGGVLRFTHVFAGEQKYLIHIKEWDVRCLRFSVSCPLWRLPPKCWRRKRIGADYGGLYRWGTRSDYTCSSDCYEHL